MNCLLFIYLFIYVFGSSEPDIALVAALDGTIHLVDTKLGKSKWSFSTGRPIYSSYQAAFNYNASEFYIDVGEDWELYFHSKRFGKVVCDLFNVFNYHLFL